MLLRVRQTATRWNVGREIAERSACGSPERGKSALLPEQLERFNSMTTFESGPEGVRCIYSDVVLHCGSLKLARKKRRRWSPVAAYRRVQRKHAASERAEIGASGASVMHIRAVEKGRPQDRNLDPDTGFEHRTSEFNSVMYALFSTHLC